MAFRYRSLHFRIILIILLLNLLWQNIKHDTVDRKRHQSTVKNDSDDAEDTNRGTPQKCARPGDFISHGSSSDTLSLTEISGSVKQMLEKSGQFEQRIEEKLDVSLRKCYSIALSVFDSYANMTQTSAGKNCKKIKNLREKFFGHCGISNTPNGETTQ